MSTFKPTTTAEGIARIKIYNTTQRIQYTSTSFLYQIEYLLIILSVDIYLNQIVWNIYKKNINAL